MSSKALWLLKSLFFYFLEVTFGPEASPHYQNSQTFAF